MDQILPRCVKISHCSLLKYRYALLQFCCSTKNAPHFPPLSATNSRPVWFPRKLTTMEKVSQKDKEDETRECCGEESCEYVPKKPVSGDIIPHILNLYGSCATARDFEIYAPDASFEDPLMCAHGVKQIKSAFYSLTKVFSESRIVEYTVTEKALSPRQQEILIDSKQYYKFLGKNIDMISLIKLCVEDGKVVRHEDWWDKKPITNRETTKFRLVGHLVETLRRGSMLTTHAMMRFGKDPTA